MWKVFGNSISMAEGDFGVPLPATISGITMTASDTLKFVFKDGVNGNTILEKEYTPSDNTLVLEFTEAESTLFAVGQYVYRLDWYQGGVFMNNIILAGAFKVVDKA